MALSIIASIFFNNIWDSNKSYLSNSWLDVTHSPIWINHTLDKLLQKTLLVGLKKLRKLNQKILSIEGDTLSKTSTEKKISLDNQLIANSEGRVVEMVEHLTSNLKNNFGV